MAKKFSRTRRREPVIASGSIYAIALGEWTCTRCGLVGNRSHLCAVCHDEVMRTMPEHRRCPYPGCAAPPHASDYDNTRSIREAAQERGFRVLTDDVLGGL